MPAKRLSPAPPLSIAGPLLDWYDDHARDLPWRARPGVAADPYRVWLSEVMLQQTTVATVRPRFAAWVARWPDVASLAAADEAAVMAAWAGLGYYARARNLVKTARAVVSEHDGVFPRTEAELRRLPGLGAYTAAAVAAIAWGEAAVVVDANVERVVARLFAIETPLPAARPAIRAAAAAITPATRAGDFAQAMMDLGATICTTRAPKCLLCPVREQCRGFARGAPERLPVKPARRVRPRRHGTIFWLERGGRVLLVTRPASGLLGGMRALPTGAWSDATPELGRVLAGALAGALADAPAEADWRLLEARVTHRFTHFDLDLTLAVATAPAHVAVDGEWWPIADLKAAGLPTLFAKAADAIGGTA